MVSGPILAVPASPLLPSHIHTSLLRHCYYIGPVGASRKQNQKKGGGGFQYAGYRSV